MTSRIFFLLAISILTNSVLIAQKDNSTPVHVAGAMKHVMWDGQLYGIIDLDTIANKKHLYGLGPVEYLSGEILILDGRSYKSTVVTDSKMIVDETYKVKAPFFVYANVDSWKTRKLPKRIQSLAQLETYLDQVTKQAQRPFAFKLTGDVETATIHIVNLPEGASVHSPDEAHQRTTSYQIANEEVIILGFFSTEHQGIFTHHDTSIHMHLITADKNQMGHLDDVQFIRGKMQLYVPHEQ